LFALYASTTSPVNALASPRETVLFCPPEARIVPEPVVVAKAMELIEERLPTAPSFTVSVPRLELSKPQLSEAMPLKVMFLLPLAPKLASAL